VVRPSQRKEVAQQAVVNRGVSIRQVCSVFSISETCYRYQPVLSPDNEAIVVAELISPPSLASLNKMRLSNELFVLSVMVGSGE
jgi:hypothetical protein